MKKASDFQQWELGMYAKTKDNRTVQFVGYNKLGLPIFQQNTGYQFCTYPTGLPYNNYISDGLTIVGPVPAPLPEPFTRKAIYNPAEDKWGWYSLPSHDGTLPEGYKALKVLITPLSYE